MQKSGSVLHRQGNNITPFNLNSSPRSFEGYRDTERISTPKGKKWNRSTSVVSREPQKFLHSTTFTRSGSSLQDRKRFLRGQGSNIQGRTSLLNSKINTATETQSPQRMKERYQYGFLNVRDRSSDARLSKLTWVVLRKKSTQENAKLML